MGILTVILLVLLVLVAILLVLIILAQDDATEGAGIIFGSAANQQFGARKGNVVTKTTSVLATIFIVTAFTLSFLFQYNRDDKFDIIGNDSETEEVQWWNTDEENADDVPLDATPQDFENTEQNAIQELGVQENVVGTEGTSEDVSSTGTTEQVSDTKVETEKNIDN